MTLKTKVVLPLFETALLCFQKNLTNIGDSNFQLEYLIMTQNCVHVNLSGNRNILGCNAM